MNGGDTSQRWRGPSGDSTAPARMSESELRNGGSGGGANVASNLASRAERFQDEKRRIVESCFAKKDPDGSMAESYITHLRIIEDAVSPSSPPPLSSGPENKKHRVIMVSVRKSGRVRMHKARENANGSFSIGKTWVLDDLSAVESFSGAPAPTSDERRRQEWAGGSGFTVTIQKPYYWQANTPKEKDFFIGSLVKIYRKYTGGKTPELLGFTQLEEEQLLLDASYRKSQSADPPPRNSRDRIAATSGSPQRSDPALRERSRESGSGLSRQPRVDRSSQDSDRRLRGSRDDSLVDQSSSDFVRSLKPIRTSRPESPFSSPARRNGTGTSIGDESSARSFNPTQSTDSFHSGQERIYGRMDPPVHPSVERMKPSATFPLPSPKSDTPAQQTIFPDGIRSPSTTRSGTLPTSQPAYEKLPAPKRPSLLQSASMASQNSQDLDSPDEFATPNATPAQSTEDVRLPSRSTDRFRRDMFGPRSDISKMPDHSVKPVESTKVPDVETTSDDSKTARDTSESQNTTPTSIAPDSPAGEEEAHRPGLGPMIKRNPNKDTANKFRKAASAFNAFKPRSGGGVEKLQETLKTPNTLDGDGITGVFTPLPKGLTPENAKRDDSGALTPVPPISAQPVNVLPEVTVTKSPAIGAITSDPAITEPLSQANSPLEKPESPLDSERKRKPKTDNSAKYAKVLGIDPKVLDGRTANIDEALDKYWGEEGGPKNAYEEMQDAIRRDLAKLETGSWLDAYEINDERVAQVGVGIDRTIAEIDELDGLLTLYNVELGTLAPDIAFIEAQSQGLQVQTANQKLLQTELKNLLETLSIQSSQLRALKEASLTQPQGINAVETALSQLYKAMLVIDPNLRRADRQQAPAAASHSYVERESVSGPLGNEISSMRAVKDKREAYREESLQFIIRLKQYMSVKYREAEAATSDGIEKNRGRGHIKTTSKIDHSIREKARRDLSVYSPLMLFSREIDTMEWDSLIQMYHQMMRPPFAEEFRDNTLSWQRIARVPMGEELDVLFTNQEKESSDGIVGRKLTVKRAKTIRADGSSRNSSGEKPRDGRVDAHEAFAGALGEMQQAIFMEQNFLVDFFHMSSLTTTDFADVASAVPPELRKEGNLYEKKPFDPDRAMAHRVAHLMEDLFISWPIEMQNLADWVTKKDALQCLGTLSAIENKLSELEESNQDFMNQILMKIQGKQTAFFGRFIDEQLKGIEDTKVKVKKRKGVIAFTKTFPVFSSAIESMLPSTAQTFGHSNVRTMVDDAYRKINKAMFESLKFIAKEGPMVMAGQNAQTTGDPGDKEALNHHILLIENMNHYIEEVDVRGDIVLQEGKDNATKEMDEHMVLYLNAVIRRPLGKLLDFIESTESLLQHANDPTSIASRASHSRSTFKKVLSTYDVKEIRRGIETLRKRVEKHFGDADDPGLSRGLVQKVLRECANRYFSVNERTHNVIRSVYDNSLEVEWKNEDVSSAFRR